MVVGMYRVVVGIVGIVVGMVRVVVGIRGVAVGTIGVVFRNGRSSCRDGWSKAVG